MSNNRPRRYFNVALGPLYYDSARERNAEIARVLRQFAARLEDEEPADEDPALYAQGEEGDMLGTAQFSNDPMLAPFGLKIRKAG